MDLGQVMVLRVAAFERVMVNDPQTRASTL
jgi:hypothetical protein